MPQSERGYHPLCAVYTRACLAPAAARLADGRLKMRELLDEVRTRVVPLEDIRRFGDPDRLLANVNTPADYAGSRGAARSQTVIVSRAYAQASAVLARDPYMILTVQRQVHDAIADAIRHAVRHRRRAGVRDRGAAEPRARRPRGRRWRFSSRARCARRRAQSRRSWRQALGTIPGRRAHRRDAQRLPERVSRSPRVPASTARARGAGRVPSRGADEKTIVEHTAINPNKAAHIGHLRNAALGDTLVRVLRFRGTPVEAQNYIDDTGVQVADVIVGFREIEQQTLDEVRQIADTTRFDYYCWDLYSRVTEWYDGDKARLDDPRRSAARSRARRQRHRRHGRASSSIASSARI